MRACYALQSTVEPAYSCSTWDAELCEYSATAKQMNDGSPHLTWNLSWLWGLSSWLSNKDSTVSTFSSVCALRLPVPRRLSTVLNFTSSLVLFFVQLLFINSAERCNLYILADFWLKFCLIYWAASKLPRLAYRVPKFALFSVSDLKDEKLIKSKPTWKLKHANSILETFEYFCQISSKSSVTISSYTVAKLGRFFWDTV